MTWNYRVMRRVAGKGTTHYYLYGIYEFYNQKKGWTTESMVPECVSIEELKEDHTLMGKAFNSPTLDYKNGKEIK
jgi:hypothetical protein